jgi:hypothetical protein
MFALSPQLLLSLSGSRYGGTGTAEPFIIKLINAKVS